MNVPTTHGHWLAFAALLASGCQAPNVDAPPALDGTTQKLRIQPNLPSPGLPGTIIVQPVFPTRKALQPVEPAQLVQGESPKVTLLNPPPAYTNQEVVGLVPATETCPPGNGHWEGGDLFGSSFVHDQKARRFCSYTWRWPGWSEPDLETLPTYDPSGKNTAPCEPGTVCEAAPEGSTWLEPSLKGVVQAGMPSDVRNMIAGRIKSQHRRAVGTPWRMPKGAASRPFGPPALGLPVQSTVYVLDDGADHSQAVADWIELTACPNGNDCPTIHQRKVFDDAEEPTSILRLAQEIVRAANDGRGRAAVINLSLGLHWRHVWEPTGDGTRLSGWFRLAHTALDAALNYARCQGVVTVAAAGNRDGGDAEEEGHDFIPHLFGSTSYPAAFGDLAPFKCWDSAADVDGTRADNDGAGENVYPVSGITADGEYSPSSRKYGRSCLTAPSQAVNVNGDPVEGSSFAAATVSGIMARMRSYMPGAHMGHIHYAWHDSLQALPENPDAEEPACHVYGQHALSSTPYRVNQCRANKQALEWTCEKGPWWYRETACELAEDTHCGDISSLDTTLRLTSSQSNSIVTTASDDSRRRDRTFALSAQPGTDCPTDTPVYSDPAKPQVSSCPFEKHDNGQPRVDTISYSPGIPGCNCSIMLTQDRAVWLLGSLSQQRLRSAALRLGTRAALSGLQSLTTGGQGAGADSTTDTIYELGDDVVENTNSGFAMQIAEALPPGIDIEDAEFSFMLEADTEPQAYSTVLPVFEEL